MKTGMKITNGLTAALVAMGIAAATATSVQAQANIITPTSVSTTSAGIGGTHINYVINGGGLSGGGTSGDILNETHDNSAYQWLCGGGAPPNIDIIFNLGGTFAVDSVHLWNWLWSNGQNTWGVKTVDISFSTDGGGSYGNLLNDVPFAKHPSGTPPVSSQTQTFPTVFGVTHIKLNDIKSYEGGSYVGFAEIRFGSAEAEPPTPVGGTVGIRTVQLEVTDAVGDLQWQSSADNFATHSNLVGKTSSDVDITDLFPGMPWTRAEATSGTNAPAYSATTKVTLSPDGRMLMIQETAAKSFVPASSNSAPAAVIIKPTAVTSTSNLGGGWDVAYTIDSSGLSGGGISDDILSETHINGSGAGGLTWLSGNGAWPNITITFNLGGTFDVDRVHLWNWTYTGATSTRGVNTMDISFSSDGVNFGDTVGDVAFTQYANASTIATSETKTFAAVSGVTHIRLTDLKADPGESYIGFSEIRFGFGDSGPPPPSDGGTAGVKTVELEVTGSIGALQWQSSADGSNWDDLSGETAGVLDVTLLYPDTPWFQVKTTSGTNAAVYSTTMKIGIGTQQHGTLIMFY
jgi:hypothetical protein